MRISDWSSDVCLPIFPAPRERDRAKRGSARRQGLRALLAAQRHARVRRRQDVEVGRQHREGARPAAGASGRGPALRPALGALPAAAGLDAAPGRSEAHTSELQSLMRISYAVFSLKKKTTK